MVELAHATADRHVSPRGLGAASGAVALPGAAQAGTQPQAAERTSPAQCLLTYHNSTACLPACCAQSAMCVPDEGGGIRVYNGSQWVDGLQARGLHRVGILLLASTVWLPGSSCFPFF